jgi:hypothetical protein
VGEGGVAAPDPAGARAKGRGPTRAGPQSSKCGRRAGGASGRRGMGDARLGAGISGHLTRPPEKAAPGPRDVSAPFRQPFGAQPMGALDAALDVLARHRDVIRGQGRGTLVPGRRVDIVGSVHVAFLATGVEHPRETDPPSHSLRFSGRRTCRLRRREMRYLVSSRDQGFIAALRKNHHLQVSFWPRVL